MRAHKLTLWCVTVLIWPFVGVVEARAADLPDLQPPVVRERHRAFLSRLVRRTVRDVALDRETYAPEYVPAALTATEAEVIVRIRRGGFLLALAGAGPAPLADAARQAALTAGGNLAEHLGLDLDLTDNALIEIEIIGDAQPIPVEDDWTLPGVIDPFMEPGVHGLVLETPTVRHRFCPTEVFTSDITIPEALKEWAKRMTASGAKIADVKLARFRTTHWYEPQKGAAIVSLNRGLTVVKPEAVTPRGLDDAITALADYMVYRQLDTGLFTYQYEPAQDRYGLDQNVIRQAGATAAIATDAAARGRTASIAAANTAIRFHLQGLTDLSGGAGAGFIATADGTNKLGLTALLALAMAVHPDAKSYAVEREKLVGGMLWLQRPSGMFLTAFPPAVEIKAQNNFPGEALLALAHDYDHAPSAAILDAFDRAIAFYREFFRAQPSPAFVAWHSQAFGRMARHTKRKDYTDFVFEMTDWLAGKQLTRDDCFWPELWGGVAAYGNGRAGVTTAHYLAGFADALSLAHAVGDETRAKRYERVVRDASRFVMQLQVRPEEAYFVRSPRDAIGGIRATPSLNLLRIDHCQHGLIGLTKARAALFPSQD